MAKHVDLEYPFLSIEGVALVLGLTVKETAEQIERRLIERGFAVYGKLPRLVIKLYSGLPAKQILAELTEEERNGALGDVLRAIAPIAAKHNVLCHRQSLQLLPFRAGFAVAVRVPFVFVNAGIPYWWFCQARATSRLNLEDLSFVGAGFRKAYADMPEYKHGDFEFIDCPKIGPNLRAGNRYHSADLPEMNVADFNDRLAMYAAAMEIVAKQIPKVVEEALKRQRARMTRTGAILPLF